MQELPYYSMDHLRYAYAMVFEAQYVLGCRPFAIQYNAVKSTSFDPSYTAVRKKKTHPSTSGTSGCGGHVTMGMIKDWCLSACLYAPLFLVNATSPFSVHLHGLPQRHGKRDSSLPLS